MRENRVELHPAFLFDCPECGKENMLRGVVVQKEEYERFGIENLDDGNPFRYISLPEYVECWNCDARFSTDPESSMGGG